MDMTANRIEGDGPTIRPVVDAIEHVVLKVRQRIVPDLPDLIVRIGGGGDARGGALIRGTFHDGSWRSVNNNKPFGELMISGSLLALDARHIASTIMHECVHAVAAARGVRETSRNGRFHNTRFKAIAESMHLVVEKSQHDGWNVTRLTNTGHEIIYNEISHMRSTIMHYRLMDSGKRLIEVRDDGVALIGNPMGTAAMAKPEHEPKSELEPKSKNGGVRRSLKCECEAPRRIQVSPSIADAGPIVCGLCGCEFA